MSTKRHPLLERILESGVVIDEDGGEVPIHSNITPAQGDFLKRVVSKVTPRTSLEVGLAFGISALFICDREDSSRAFRHIAIDPNQSVPREQGGYGNLGIKNLEKAGFRGNVTLHEQSSTVALPKLVESGDSIEFAFIDGWHTFDYALIDFFYIDQLLSVGGVVVLDDVSLPSITKLCRYIARNRAYSLYDVHWEPVTSWKRRLYYGTRAAFPIFERIVDSNLIELEGRRGFYECLRCVAFRKDDVDTRPWSFHREF